MIGPISDTANSAVVPWARYARGDRLELPDWLCPRSALRATRSSRRERSGVTSDQARWIVSKRSEIVLSKEAACIPEKKRKTALAIVKDRQLRRERAIAGAGSPGNPREGRRSRSWVPLRILESTGLRHHPIISPRPHRKNAIAPLHSPSILNDSPVLATPTSKPGRTASRWTTPAS